MQYPSLQISKNRLENFSENALDTVDIHSGEDDGTVGQALRIPSVSNSYNCDLLGQKKMMDIW